MDTKTTLHGPGVYYLALHGGKQQAIFQSVFEYDYALQALTKLSSAKLLAYVLDAELVQLVVRVERDWLDTASEIFTAFDNMHEQVWGKRRQVLAEQCTALLIDENAYLSELILQLHDWPRYSGQVAEGSLWPYSSDAYYRSIESPTWLDTDSMLNLLSHSRRNRAQHYIDVTRRPIGNKHNLQQGNNPEYLALARPQFVAQHLARHPIAGIMAPSS